MIKSKDTVYFEWITGQIDNFKRQLAQGVQDRHLPLKLQILRAERDYFVHDKRGKL